MSPKELEELNDGEMIVLRTAKRADKKWRRIRALPIFDNGPTIMPNRRDMISAKFRLDYYTTDLHIKNNTKHLKYEDIFQDYKPYFEALQNEVAPDDGTTENEMAAKDLQELREFIDRNEQTEPVQTVTINDAFDNLPSASEANQPTAVLPQAQAVQQPDQTLVKADWITHVYEPGKLYASFLDDEREVESRTMQGMVVNFLQRYQLSGELEKTYQKAQAYQLVQYPDTVIYSNQEVLGWFNDDAELAFDFKQELEKTLNTVATDSDNGGTDLPF